METRKKRVIAWLYPDLIEKMNKIILTNNMKNHTEFIEQAVDFYIGYLSNKDSTTYLSKVLVGVLQATIEENNNRMSTNLFRLSVEMSIMMNLLASGISVSEDDIKKIRGRCAKEIKSNRGRINFEDALDYQNGE